MIKNNKNIHINEEARLKERIQALRKALKRISKLPTDPWGDDYDFLRDFAKETLRKDK